MKINIQKQRRASIQLEGTTSTTKDTSEFESRY